MRKVKKITLIRLSVAIIVGVASRGATADPPTPLTFEQRLEAQRAIEGVYWSRRIWPAENPAPKPSLSAAMPDAVIRAKVEDYLKKSNALAMRWHRPVTGEQLQAELDRMARDTRDGTTLNALFNALGNDPYVIAETLARQSLVERLIRNWYSADTRFHADVKAQAEAALAVCTTVTCMNTMGGEYSQTLWRRQTDAMQPESVPAQLDGVVLEPDDWDDHLSQLAARFDSPADSIPIGQLSGIDETSDSFNVVALISRTEDEYATSSVTWPKRTFDAWWTETQTSMSASLDGDPATFALPSAPMTSCATNSWTVILGEDVPRERQEPTAVWTGSEMIVWGGYNAGSTVETGGRYNPATDTWISTGVRAANVPSGRVNHSAVWTGTEMIVWGGMTLTSPIVNTDTGARFNPMSNSWIPTSTGANVPAPRRNHSAVWTGSEMIVWGGADSGFHNDGARYNPVTNTWSTVQSGNAPAAREGATAVWTGAEMIVWGGYNGNYLNTGGRYNPSTNSWNPVSTGANVPAGRLRHTAVWTGNEMIVYGGIDQNGNLSSGARYSPSGNVWTQTSSFSARSAHTAVWTGAVMIVWGGVGAFGTGGRYNPSTNLWTPTGTGANTPEERAYHAAVWTGTEMIVWGGLNGPVINTGGRYNPVADSWLPTSMNVTSVTEHAAVWTGAEMIVWGGLRVSDGTATHANIGRRFDPSTNAWTPTSLGANVPNGRSRHTAIWTGNEMIVWGGYALGNLSGMATGGRYDPISDTWSPTSIGANVPLARSQHTAVWTGDAMIVWGGNSTDELNSGGVYRPASDQWTPTSVGSNVPTPRSAHTAIWTGSEMIVWGGYDGNFGTSFNSGGRYDPLTNAWTPTSLAPAGRNFHTAVWTGTQMIVWSGFTGIETFDTGGRYTPATNTWTATSTSNAPDGRLLHAAAWTGTEMIVWGGTGQLASEPGGRYNPTTNTWIKFPLNAVSVAYGPTAVWTGTQMIVWGGGPDNSGGGSYCACANGAFYYRDVDGDGFGASGNPISLCAGSILPGYAPNNLDCDDSLASVYPGAPDVCNGLDDDCDGSVDNGPNATCSDGNACTHPDTCVAGACVGLGPLDCDNGLYCDGVESCDPDTGCQAGASVECDDGVPCTVDSCDEPTDSCSSTPNHLACDDSLYCNGSEICTASGCAAGVPVVCDDAVACTVDSCDEGSDSCVFAPNNNSCDDGLYCNGVETCGVTGCRGGAPVVCDDGVACTVDSCVEGTDSCAYTPNSAACDDSNVCTDDVCTATGCAYSDNTAPCDDASDCTIGDVCQSGICVGSTTRPMPKTKGHYKKLCKRNELTAQDAACVAQTAPLTFGDVDTVEEVCDEINGHDSDLPGHDSDERHCTKDETELIVLALNICTGRICPSQPIDSEHSDNMTVQESLDEADQLFGNTARDKDTCHYGKDLAKEINNGKALRMDTLQIDKLANAIKLTWTPPFIGDEQAILRYEVWRSVRGADTFVLIHAGTSTAYIDSTNGDFDYEVLVEIQD